jgi:hypothetical protein
MSFQVCLSKIARFGKSCILVGLDVGLDHLKVRENISVDLEPEVSTFKKITYQPCSD